MSNALKKKHEEILNKPEPVAPAPPPPPEPEVPKLEIPAEEQRSNVAPLKHSKAPKKSHNKFSKFKLGDK